MPKRAPDRRSKTALPRRRLSGEARVTSGFAPRISEASGDALAALKELVRDPLQPRADASRMTSGFVTAKPAAPAPPLAPSATPVTLPNVTTRRSAELSALVLDEIQSPLLVALARLDSVTGDPSASEEARAAARDAQEIVEASRRLLLDFVDTASSEAGGLTPRSERTDIGRLISDTCLSLAEFARRRRVIVDASSSPRGSSAWLDPRLTRRLLRNLVQHAVQNATEGSTVIVRAVATAPHVEVSVQHDGEEVPPTVCRNAFERFAKLDESHPAMRHSPGLTLYFCRVAVDAMHGKIWMDPLEPGGARLCFSIPSK